MFNLSTLILKLVAFLGLTRMIKRGANAEITQKILNGFKKVKSAKLRANSNKSIDDGLRDRYDIE